MQTAGIKQEEAEKEYIRCHEQTERKPHCVSEYQQMCKFQAQGRLRVKHWDTFQRAGQTIQKARYLQRTAMMSVQLEHCTCVMGTALVRVYEHTFGVGG